MVKAAQVVKKLVKTGVYTYEWGETNEPNIDQLIAENIKAIKELRKSIKELNKTLEKIDGKNNRSTQ